MENVEKKYWICTFIIKVEEKKILKPRKNWILEDRIRSNQFWIFQDWGKIDEKINRKKQVIVKDCSKDRLNNSISWVIKKSIQKSSS